MTKDDAPTLFTLPTRKPSVVTRLTETAALIYGETAAERNDLGFIHTLHANCYLPRGRTTERRYIHKNGPLSIMLEAGALHDPKRDEFVDQPLPYGGKPRALLGYINTYALQKNTNTVPLGRSFTEFVRLMSGEATGGAKGAIGLWKRQMMALSASTMRIGGNGLTTKVDIVGRLQVWFPPEPDQMSLFPTELVLTSEYLDTLKEHAMPIDMAALRALQHDPLAFDVYAWLAYRLPRVRQVNGAHIPLKMLYEQFGGDYGDIYSFKRRFLSALRKARTLYLSARLDVTKSGVTIYSSPPLIEHKTSVRLLRSR